MVRTSSEPSVWFGSIAEWFSVFLFRFGSTSFWFGFGSVQWAFAARVAPNMPGVGGDVCSLRPRGRIRRADGTRRDAASQGAAVR